VSLLRAAVASSSPETQKGVSSIFPLFTRQCSVSAAPDSFYFSAVLIVFSLAWGPPSGILIHTIGFGFLAGADVYDVVLILRNRRAVKAFANPKVSLGAELSVAAGPLGAGAIVDSGIEAAPVLSYVKSKGLYGGAQVDGEFTRRICIFIARYRLPAFMG